MERYAVIMAGGSGTRLWPLSRESRPKQFICLEDGDCMLARTIKRLCRSVMPEHCYIVTGSNLADITRKTAGNLIPPDNIILEPARKNTAACIAYSAMLLERKLGENLLCYVPADSHVKDEPKYLSAIEAAFSAAEKTAGLVIVGVEPTYPSTGYGYIQVDCDTAPEFNPDSTGIDGILPDAGSFQGWSAALTEEAAFGKTGGNSPEPGATPRETALDFPETGEIPRMPVVIRVKRFVEKPDAETAENYVASGNYLWNCGIVAGRADVITSSIRSYLPGHFELLSEALKNDSAGNFPERIRNAYDAMLNISFDNGVLEKSSSVYVVWGLFDWDDIGSLDALSRALPSDMRGNAVKGRHFGMDTRDSVIYADIPVATIGISNMVVAATCDAVVVCARERSQEVKAMVEMLKENGGEDLI